MINANKALQFICYQFVLFTCARAQLYGEAVLGMALFWFVSAMDIVIVLSTKPMIVTFSSSVLTLLKDLFSVLLMWFYFINFNFKIPYKHK